MSWNLFWQSHHSKGDNAVLWNSSSVSLKSQDILNLELGLDRGREIWKTQKLIQPSICKVCISPKSYNWVTDNQSWSNFHSGRVSVREGFLHLRRHWQPQFSWKGHLGLNCNHITSFFIAVTFCCTLLEIGSKNGFSHILQNAAAIDTTPALRQNNLCKQKRISKKRNLESSEAERERQFCSVSVERKYIKWSADQLASLARWSLNLGSGKGSTAITFPRVFLPLGNITIWTQKFFSEGHFIHSA